MKAIQMLSSVSLRLAASVIAVILSVAIFGAWRDARRDRDQLAAELATTKQLLASADARQRDRDAQLTQTLASLAADKNTVVTPAQVIHDLPGTLPLPTPIVLQTPPAPAGNAASGGAKAQPLQPQAVIPA